MSVTNLSNLRPGSVELERVFSRALGSHSLTLLQIHIAYHQYSELGTHETTKSLFRSAHDWLAAYVEAGIDQYGAAGPAPEGRQQAGLGSAGWSRRERMRAE
jgi:hypothetical protein